MRKFTVAGNWKMFKSPRETKEFLKDLLPKVAPHYCEYSHQEWLERKEEHAHHARVIVFPTTLSLWVAQEMLRNTGIGFGAQNFYPKTEGAFTGETSVSMVHELGAQYVLVGHSERRTLFHETGELLSEKIKSSQSLGLIPIYCVGETLDEREHQLTFKTVEKQLSECLTAADFSKEIIVAYEPVWAIGTGKTASSTQANEVHQFIRQWLTKNTPPGVAEKTTILYGGSVKPENAKDLASQSDIDGFLVGGASLVVDSFIQLIANSKSI